MVPDGNILQNEDTSEVSAVEADFRRESITFVFVYIHCNLLPMELCHPFDALLENQVVLGMSTPTICFDFPEKEVTELMPGEMLLMRLLTVRSWQWRNWMHQPPFLHKANPSCPRSPFSVSIPFLNGTWSIHTTLVSDHLYTRK